MRLLTKILFFILLVGFTIANAAQPTFLQYFFSIKKVLPDTKQVGVFLPESEFSVQKEKIAMASKRSGIKVKVFLISDMKSIGENMKSINGIDILLVYENPLLMEKSSRMFILSKCKDKKIPLITASEKYSKFGALLGLLKDENGHSKIVLNLKYSPNLAAIFTDEYVKKTGIAKRIQ